MPTKKIADLPDPRGYYTKPKPPCHDPSHNPPTHMVYEPGIWEHECPGCGEKRTFTVQTSHWCGP
jgi:hypothetical protein